MRILAKIECGTNENCPAVAEVGGMIHVVGVSVEPGQGPSAGPGEAVVAIPLSLFERAVREYVGDTE